MTSCHPSYEQRRRLSQHLTMLLRHDKRFYSACLRPDERLSEEQKQMRINGFASVRDVVDFLKREEGSRGRDGQGAYRWIDEGTVRWIVDNQAEKGRDGKSFGKVRMELNAAKTHVRAINGHSNGVSISDYKVVPTPPVAFHLTNDEALKKILGSERQGLRPMGRDHIHMYSRLDPVKLNPRDTKRNVIVQINFPVGDEGKMRQLGTECLDPEVNGYLFSRSSIPAELLERKCTLQEYVENGYKFT